ncbi:ABC transporter ATP-binding protein [uncultured Anaerovibrio sp.]|uniref:ABC transporter ATP-binding protein n=1 Tax=uncultured Anaerovibrio sp. TaxID=361586 RepID=UPI002601DBCC|nr:oligopeptide/dipeptide ABC transporter ATP-binding protein [uncultured Anaerovibrio sp.]
MSSKPLLSVRNITKHFVTKKSFWGRPKEYAYSLNGISFDINPGETLGLVGESGCGKTTAGRTIMGIYKPTAGEVYLHGEKLDLSKGPDKRIQMIFQDPYACLNPRMTVGEIIAEPLEINRVYDNDKAKGERVYELLELVGLSREQANRFPHEFSGGQRQRIGIARALAVNPDIIICDEPISALDVSIQAQVVNLMRRLQKELGLTYLFIAHDLAMVKYISDRVAVMYMGSIMELADAESLYTSPMHPYTKSLLAAIPVPDPNVRQDISLIRGEVGTYNGQGCPFAPRCEQASELCRTKCPEIKHIEGHQVACHLY